MPWPPIGAPRAYAPAAVVAAPILNRQPCHPRLTPLIAL